MPFLAYVAVILVSLGGILFELNWLTSPKLEGKSAVQASTQAATPTSAPPNAVALPKAADETLPKSANAMTAPRNVAPTVTMVPGASGVTTAATATPPEQTAPQRAETPSQQAATAPAINPPPGGVANAGTSTNTNAASVTPVETSGAASTDYKREFTTDAKAADAKSGSSASAATFTPAAANSSNAAVATSSNNKCDIAACSAAYQSFRASDCTYQPLDGAARKICDRAPETAQRAAVPETTRRAAAPEPVQRASAPVRDPRMEAAARKSTKEAELRAVEREVRRVTANEVALNPRGRRLDRSLDSTFLDRSFERNSGRSEIILIDPAD